MYRVGIQIDRRGHNRHWPGDFGHRRRMTNPQVLRMHEFTRFRLEFRNYIIVIFRKNTRIRQIIAFSGPFVIRY